MHMLKLMLFFPRVQFSFHKDLDTCGAILKAISAVQRSLDTGCEVCMIVLNFSAVFDCVSHEALILILKQMGHWQNFP